MVLNHGRSRHSFVSTCGLTEHDAKNGSFAPSDRSRAPPIKAAVALSTCLPAVFTVRLFGWITEIAGAGRDSPPHQRWLLPSSRDLAYRRFATVAEVREGRLEASYFCCAPARVCAPLLHVVRARLCRRGG